MFDVSVGQETASKPSTVRRKPNDASEARLLTRQMHKRTLAWELQMCVEALKARPIDHARVAEVTEIQFASDELVDVAAQCLADLARESESVNDSVEHASATTAASSQTKKESVDAGQAPQEPEKNLRVQLRHLVSRQVRINHTLGQVSNAPQHRCVFFKTL